MIRSIPGRRAILGIFIGICGIVFAGRAEGTKRDTVEALVLDTSFKAVLDFDCLSAQEILHYIDSLLETQSILPQWIKALNAYVENNMMQHDNYMSLIGYSSAGFFPADELYNGYVKGERLHPVFSSDYLPDSFVLRLVDTLNYCYFAIPVSNVITSPFGWRDGKMHNGIDIDLQVWDPVRAAFDGVVRYAGKYQGYGRVVVVRHYNGLETLYAHLHRIKVKEGDVIAAGEVVGLGGSSGRSTGSHLHFEVRFLGIPINPVHLIDFDHSSLHAAEVILKKKKQYQYIAYPLGARLHTLKKGDSLHKIAERYGVTVAQLRAWNHLPKKPVLKVGDQLIIAGH